MSAYWINVFLEVRDPAKVAAYAELATPAIAEAGGRFLARGVPEAVFEQGRETRTVIIEFSSVGAARACYESPLYQKALAALDDGAVRDIRIVPGVG
ncbi:DUF1330 domain-containing protein [Nocardioides sp. GXQ0305]|uniref:DUF1330 domain-containing protein n=1 Tax=Nocardioides sp. GXQ0305 TaxID=3423912 RepID=UPI003D7DE618